MCANVCACLLIYLCALVQIVASRPSHPIDQTRRNKSIRGSEARPRCSELIHLSYTQNRENQHKTTVETFVPHKLTFVADRNDQVSALQGLMRGAAASNVPVCPLRTGDSQAGELCLLGAEISVRFCHPLCEHVRKGEGVFV